MVGSIWRGELEVLLVVKEGDYLLLFLRRNLVSHFAPTAHSTVWETVRGFALGTPTVQKRLNHPCLP